MMVVVAVRHTAANPIGFAMAVEPKCLAQKILASSVKSPRATPKTPQQMVMVAMAVHLVDANPIGYAMAVEPKFLARKILALSVKHPKAIRKMRPAITVVTIGAAVAVAVADRMLVNHVARSPAIGIAVVGITILRRATSARSAMKPSRQAAEMTRNLTQRCKRYNI